MDLEAYRRTYMQAEGIGNTPVRFVKRAYRLAKSIARMPSSVKSDINDSKERKEARNQAKEYIKKHGKSGEAMAQIIDNRPKGPMHTFKNLDQIGNNIIAMGKSINEVGQTAAAIVGTRRTNTYDGQDLEKGISFALTGANVVNNSRLKSRACKSN